MVADAFFAKERYVSGVVDLGLKVVSKLRKAARLFREYKGIQKSCGRKKLFDRSRINDTDFEKSDAIIFENGVKIESIIAHGVSLKMKNKSC